jgi:hypothetical protein
LAACRSRSHSVPVLVSLARMGQYLISLVLDLLDEEACKQLAQDYLYAEILLNSEYRT